MTVKKLKAVGTACAVCGLLACAGDPAIDAVHQRADSLMSAGQPDSALLLLQALDGVGAEDHQPSTSSHSLTRSQRMRHELLRAKAKNKAYVSLSVGGDLQSVGGDLQSPDAVMKEVADYYYSHGTSSERMEAYYLLGCTYRDMGEAPQALQCFQNAVDIADTTSNRQLLIRIYGQMAELYDAQNLPGDEIAAMRRIQHYALQEQDSLMYIRALELMTKPYYKLGDTAKVIETVWEAHRLYTGMGDSRKAVNAFATLAHILAKRGQLEEAGRLLWEYETKGGLLDSCGNIQRGYEMYYYIKGNYLLAAGKTDSAETFFRRLLPSPSLPTSLHADAYRGLLSVYQKRKASKHLQSSDSIVKYARLFEAAIDSLNNRRRIEAVHQMAALYDYHRYQQQADREARSAKEARSHANIAIVLMVLVLVAATAVVVGYRRSKQRELDKMSGECLVLGGLLAKARLELEEERKAASEAQSLDSLETGMQEKLEEKTEEVRELEDRLRQLEQHYRSVTQLSTLEKRKNSEAVKAIRKRTEWKHGAVLPSADEWIRLTNQFRLDFPHYYATLTEGRKLATKELRTCMLLMLDFKEGEIAGLLDVKPQRVTNIKKRVNMKLFGDSSATTLSANLAQPLRHNVNGSEC